MQKLHDWWDRAPIWQPFALVFVVSAILVVLTNTPRSHAPEDPPAPPAAAAQGR